MRRFVFLIFFCLLGGVEGFAFTFNGSGDEFATGNCGRLGWLYVNRDFGGDGGAFWVMFDGVSPGENSGSGIKIEPVKQDLLYIFPCSGLVGIQKENISSGQLRWFVESMDDPVKEFLLGLAGLLAALMLGFGVIRAVT